MNTKSILSRRGIVLVGSVVAAMTVILVATPGGRSSGGRAPVATNSQILSHWQRLLSPGSYKKDPLFAATAREHNVLTLRASDDTAEAIRESDLLEHEAYWATRLTYPTGEFSPKWVRDAVTEDRFIERAVPLGAARKTSSASPLSLDPVSFTSIGPSLEHMTGCSGCFD